MAVSLLVPQKEVLHMGAAHSCFSYVIPMYELPEISLANQCGREYI
jgi:hypothetical protein